MYLRQGLLEDSGWATAVLSCLEAIEVSNESSLVSCRAAPYLVPFTSCRTAFGLAAAARVPLPVQRHELVAAAVLLPEMTSSKRSHGLAPSTLNPIQMLTPSEAASEPAICPA